MGENIVSSVEKFWDGLLSWHMKNRRDFPWRTADNPFHVLIAEILLQQTHVRKVQDVYERLVSRFVAPRQLAEADLRDIKSIISPLGLRYRAERLKKCAEIISDEFDGQVPDTYEQLVLLPGVGPYIADAVLCYAFVRATVPIDTNVIRLFCRYFGFKSEKSRPRTDSVLAENIRKLYRFENTRAANLAVLDFAGTVCTASRPACKQCPILNGCAALGRLSRPEG